MALSIVPQLLGVSGLPDQVSNPAFAICCALADKATVINVIESTFLIMFIFLMFIVQIYWNFIMHVYYFS